MNNSVYRYHMSRKTIYLSVFVLLIFILLGVGLYELYEGGYLSAWFTSFVVALIALMSLSIPRKIILTDELVQIECLLDITELRCDEIASVRAVRTSEMKWMFPFFGAYGFFGYYGHYFDLKHFDRVRIYAAEWCNMVEITDIYEDRLYLSCRDRDRFISELRAKIDRLHSENRILEKGE